MAFDIYSQVLLRMDGEFAVASNPLDRHLRCCLFVLIGKFAVKLFVTLRGHRPGEISRHRAIH